MKKMLFATNVAICLVIVSLMSSCSSEEYKTTFVPPSTNDTIVVPKDLFFEGKISAFAQTNETLCKGVVSFEQNASLTADGNDVEYILPSNPEAKATILLNKDTILVEEFTLPEIIQASERSVVIKNNKPIQGSISGTDAFSDSQSAIVSGEWAYDFILQKVDTIAYPHIEIQSIEFSHADTTIIDDQLSNVGLNYEVVYSYANTGNKYENEDSLAQETIMIRPYYFQKKVRKDITNELKHSYLICDTTMRYEADAAYLRVIVRRVNEYTIAPNDTVPVNNREFTVIRVGKAGSETLYVDNGTPYETEEHTDVTISSSSTGKFFLEEQKSTHTWTALFEGEKIKVPHVDAIVLTVQSITWSDGETSFSFPFTGDVKCTKKEMVHEENMGSDYINTRIFTIETTLNGNFFTSSTGKTVLRVHP